MNVSDWLDKVFRAALDPACSYANRKLLRVEPEENGGVGVSTAWVTDAEMWETALLDAEGVKPVERYESEADAILGHAKWVEQARMVTEVIRIGLPGIAEDKMVPVVKRPATGR